MNKREVFWKCAVFFLLVIYLGMFAYLNLAKLTQHVDSDLASGALLAREIWTEKTLTPDDWYSSTERYVFAVPSIASVFYGMTGSMVAGLGIACVLVGAVLAGTFYWFLRKTRLSVTASLTAVLALCAIPINGLRNDGQMVPFVMLCLFLFSNYYALHSILTFLAIIFYLHLRKGTIGRREVLGWICLFSFTFVLALGGQKCLQMVILPMVAVEVVSLFAESDGFTNRLPKSRYYASGYVGTLALTHLIATSVFKGQKDYVMYLQTPRQVMERIFVSVPASVLENFGIAGEACVGTFASLMQMLIWAFLALVGFGLLYIFRKKSEVVWEQKIGLVILTASLGITAFIIAFTTTGTDHNYLFFAWYVAVVTVAILIDCSRKKKSWFADLILLAVCAFAVLNIKYTYKDALTTTDNLKEYEEVADFLIGEEIKYGYAEFWDADRLSIVRDGAVTMGCSYVMEDLKMYWWLTSTKWYPPNLPEEMRTAYVVRIPKKEAFEAQFSEEDAVELGFENEIFAVYVSDINYMKMQ